MERCSGIVLLSAVLLLGACNLPPRAGQPPTPLPEALTATAETAAAMSLPPATNTPLSPTASLPTLPPETPTLAPASPPTPAPRPCNRAEFLADASIPDGSAIPSYETFTKTWRLRNLGTCTWTTAYRVVFDRGDQMLAPDSVPLGGSVAPGSTIDVSVPMEAPGTPGTYKGYWKLQDAAGVVFGIGASGDEAFWVEVKSVSSSPPGPNFDVAFQNVHACSGLQYSTFWVGDVGGTTFESAQVEVKDLDTGTVLYGPLHSNAPFLGTADDCPPGASSMGPGSVYFVAVSIGASSPHDDNARLTLKLCTIDNLSGDCVTKTLDFVTP